MLYLLHATIPANQAGKHSARHYLGYSPTIQSLSARLMKHRSGRGAHLTKALAGLPNQKLLLATVIQGGREEERLLKRRKEFSRLCPVCNPMAPIGSVDTPLPPPARRVYRRRSAPPGREIGGALPASRQTHSATSCPPGLLPASGTS
jgi:hypothetical protein